MPYRFVVHSDCLIYLFLNGGLRGARIFMRSRLRWILLTASENYFWILRWRMEEEKCNAVDTFRTHFDILKADLLPKQHSWLLKCHLVLHNTLETLDMTRHQSQVGKIARLRRRLNAENLFVLICMLSVERWRWLKSRFCSEAIRKALTLYAIWMDYVLHHYGVCFHI